MISPNDAILVVGDESLNRAELTAELSRTKKSIAELCASLGEDSFVPMIVDNSMKSHTADYKSNPEIVVALAKFLGLSESQIAEGTELDFAFEFEPTLQTAGQEIWISFGDVLSYDEPLAPDAYIDTRFTQSITVE